MREILNIADVLKRTGLSRSEIYRRLKVGEFPAPVPLGKTGGRVGWLSDEIDSWIDSRAALRGTAGTTPAVAAS